MATLDIITSMTMTSQGSTRSGKQGEATSSADTPLSVTVSGTSFQVVTTVGNGAAIEIWDASEQTTFTTFDNLFFWADQTVHLQLIDTNATGTNVIFSVTQYQPFVLSDGHMLAAADETQITDASSTLRAIDIVVVGNDSGSTANVHLLLIS